LKKKKTLIYTPPPKPNIALAINLGKKKRGGGGRGQVSDFFGRLITNLFNNYRQLLLNPYLDACLLLLQQPKKKKLGEKIKKKKENL